MDQDKKSSRATVVVGLVVVVGAIMLLINAFRSDANDVANILPNPSQGPENATIVIREYSDFQCPACRAAQPGLEGLLTKYPDQIRLEFNHFPLYGKHLNAETAALASACAAEQDKFWEYHDLLFDRQNEWSKLPNPRNRFADYFDEQKGNGDQFQACLKNKKYLSAVKEDVNEGYRLDIDSTPTFFINNKRQVGGRSLAEWESLLAGQLRAQSGPMVQE